MSKRPADEIESSPNKAARTATGISAAASARQIGLQICGLGESPIDPAKVPVEYTNFVADLVEGSKGIIEKHYPSFAAEEKCSVFSFAMMEVAALIAADLTGKNAMEGFEVLKKNEDNKDELVTIKIAPPPRQDEDSDEDEDEEEDEEGGAGDSSPDPFVVVRKMYHGWYCDSGPNDVGVETRVFKTREAAVIGMRRWMAEAMLEVLLTDDHKAPYDFHKSKDETVKAMREKMYAYYKAHEADKSWDRDAFRAALGPEPIFIEKAYKEFFRRTEYASEMETMEIQQSE